MNIAYTKKMVLRLAILATTGFIGQTALAVCPDVKSTDIVTALGSSNSQTIYFCKQIMPEPSYAIAANSLVSGGSQTIVIGSATQTSPIQQSSINLTSSGLIGSLPLKPLVTTFNFPPLNSGALGRAALFNFYTRVDANGSNDQCSGSIGGVIRPNQFNIITNYIRNNASVLFKSQASGSNTLIPAKRLDNGNELAVIENAEIKSGDSILKANITFIHANTPTTGQYFTDERRVNQFCWVAVRTRIDINDDSTKLSKAGAHTVDIGVYKP